MKTPIVSRKGGRILDAPAIVLCGQLALARLTEGRINERFQ
jgi:hypothetical protein